MTITVVATGATATESHTTATAHLGVVVTGIMIVIIDMIVVGRGATAVDVIETTTASVAEIGIVAEDRDLGTDIGAEATNIDREAHGTLVTARKAIKATPILLLVVAVVAPLMLPQNVESQLLPVEVYRLLVVEEEAVAEAVTVIVDDEVAKRVENVGAVVEVEVQRRVNLAPISKTCHILSPTSSLNVL
mmetsp:Transcript_21690/g.32284  ORF Transcript_21690/g.32284 Transcript_21690/m.32284 type:complete len:190 (+) Transcript_21690:2357-2926(+)